MVERDRLGIATSASPAAGKRWSCAKLLTRAERSREVDDPLERGDKVTKRGGECRVERDGLRPGDATVAKWENWSEVEEGAGNRDEAFRSQRERDESLLGGGCATGNVVSALRAA